MTPLQWLQVVQYELMLFAGFWFVIGMADELAIDVAWIWLLLRGRVRSAWLKEDVSSRPLTGVAAVFIPAWREAGVIGATISHALGAWGHAELRLYIGCYRNDPDTIAAAMKAAASDRRVRLVIHDRNGPTTKADCLNRLYGALTEDELRSGQRARFVVLHDAEDMVHPAALVVMDAALDGAGFVQLPVRPETMPQSPWVSGHYADEFTESHAKAMVVRDAIGAALPAAGVGCAISREILHELAEARKAELERSEGPSRNRRAGPFAPECLTEDYELGWRIARSGRRGRFLRLRDQDGQLIATRSYFPDTLGEAVRQKTRWVHGIAFQSWDRLGWWGRTADLWMALRDRRGPLVALVLFTAYLLVVIGTALGAAEGARLITPLASPPEVRMLMTLCLAGLAWRLLLRFVFTAREYGISEGLRAVLRIPVANVIAIIAGRRALLAYLRSLNGTAVTWEKTEHRGHPALASLAAREARA
ncbi:glycosyl transferase family protein [Novosphingobium flavum]|uniref:Glycosyl transferase family protein n=2 Tax=Novosphingobium flavum TaxID=1778672 RepID=A0A7X1FUM6_9SPHN|nr:glycosyl transferase family protein [Novosphingobium flavum]